MYHINLLTVCTEKFPTLYARKLIKRFGQITNLNFTPYCLTDRPREIADVAQSLDRAVNAKGWWNKVLLFNPELPEGWNLYLDLDIVLLDNFDREIMYAINENHQMACVSDAIAWMGEKFNSSLMIFKTGALDYIYRNFINSGVSLFDRPGGDQVWVGPQLYDILYIDEKYPNLKKNLKCHIGTMDGDRLSIPFEIDEQIKMIDCSGDPKPHQLEKVPYIKRNWHDI